MAYSELTITVPECFVKYADNEYAKGTYDSRKNCDSLLLEWYTIHKSGENIQAPLNWRHDFIIDGKKVDVKEISTKYFNIKNRQKIQQFKESIEMGQLDCFLYYQTDKPKDRLLKAGDEVTVKFISKLLDASSEISKVKYGDTPYIDLRYRNDINFN